MVTVVSFNKRLPPAAAKTGRGTLAELMAKEKRFADAKTAAGEIESPTIMQGFGKLANVAVNAMQESRAANDYSEQQGRFRTLMASIDPEKGATSQQLEQSGEFDPDVMMELFKDRRQRAQQLADHDRDIAREDYVNQRELGEAADIRREGYKRDDFTNARTVNQTIDSENRGVTRQINAEGRQVDITKDAEGREVSREIVRNDREKAEDLVVKQAEIDEKMKQYKLELADGRRRVVTGAEAVALGGQKDRQYVTDAQGQVLDDITPDLKTAYTYRNATPEEEAQYGLLQGQPYKMKVGNDGSVEPISIGAGIPLSEQGSTRVALIEEFNAQLPNVLSAIDAGELTGPVSYAKAKLGYGEGGAALRQITQAADLISRFLTGAGKNQTEIAEFQERYMPEIWNDSDTVRNKTIVLSDALNAMKSGVLSQDFDKWRNSPERLQNQEKKRKAAEAAKSGGGNGGWTVEEVP